MPLTTLPISQYSTLLNEKVKTYSELMAAFYQGKPEIFNSPVSHYRMRAEFRIWHEGDNLYQIMFDKNTKKRIRIDHFPVACQLINDIMAILIPYLRDNDVLRNQLFQIDYLATLSNQIMVSLIYHHQLTDYWHTAAQSLRVFLQEKGFNVQLIGRAHNQKICLDHDYVDECLTINQQPIIYRQIENTFTQPNAHINIKMLEWVLKMTENAQGDLLELYCGNGNFSLALARHFRKVLATEITKSSVNAARHNIAINHINNVTIARLSDDEFSQAMTGERQFNRLNGIDLTSYQANTVLVDPPRCGLSPKTLSLIAPFQHIIYISCNPLSLHDNLRMLCQTHDVTNLAFFDQFPYTDHIETGVILTKR